MVAKPNLTGVRTTNGYLIYEGTEAYPTLHVLGTIRLNAFQYGKFDPGFNFTQKPRIERRRLLRRINRMLPMLRKLDALGLILDVRQPWVDKYVVTHSITEPNR
jgi:hypothetical protein